MSKLDFSEIHFDNCSATAREMREQLWAKEEPKKKEKVEKHPLFGGLPWKMLAYIILAATTAATASKIPESAPASPRSKSPQNSCPG